MALSEVVDLLACPVCGGPVALQGPVLRCDDGHAFDVARQGYVTLSRGAIRHPGDGHDMVAARERVQSAGLLDGLTRTLVDVVGDRATTVLDVGAGTGHHTAAVLEAVPGRRGVALDSSRAALRRAARAHPRLGAVGGDVVEGLPVREGVIDVVVVTFAPRNATAFDRVLTPDGAVVVVIPGPDHLAELIGPMGMLSVGADKQARLDRSMEGFVATDRRRTIDVITPDVAQVADLALMGPAGFHATAEVLRVRAAAMSPVTSVRTDVILTTYVRG